MASWNTSGNAPTDFLDILSDEDDEDVEELEEDERLEDEDLEAEETEPFEAENLEVEETEETEPFKHNEPAAVADEDAMSSRSRSRSPLLRAPYAAAGSGSPPVVPLNVVVTAPLDGDINDATEEDHVFHLADEHRLFQQGKDVAAEQQRRPRRGSAGWRGGAARHGRGRGRRARGQVPSGGPQWVSGDRLVQVYVDDDDVPEDLRENIMRVVNAREAARVRLVNRARREREESEEEFLDADDGEVESFFAAEGTSNQFEWSPVMADFQGEREQFLPQQTGAVVASENPYAAFRQFWDEDMLTHIVTETNRYAAGLAGSSASFAQDWYDTNIHEILVLFSFWIMLGIIRMPSIKSCFTTNPLLQTNVFRKLFSRNRYINLCRAFYLNDNSSRPTDSIDVLYSLGPIVDRLNARFQEAYIPSQNICIDESLTLWKGNLSCHGVKTFELCESATGYLWSFFIYRGAGTSYDPGLPSTTLKSTTTVLNLIKPLLNKGYTLFMDHWFNSPLLARFLKTRKTDCVGTLRANSTDVPPLISLCKLKDGQFVARHSSDVVVLAYQDKKCKIATISTYHGDSQGQMEAKPYRPTKYKPQVIIDYNKGMGGIDRKESMPEPYLLERKRCKKWNVKFFKHLLNCSILNARILLQNSMTTLKEHIVFRLELVDQILQHHLQHVPKSHQNHPVSSSLSHSQPQRHNSVQHFPRQTDQLANDGRRRRWRCHVCKQHKIYRRTTFTCSVCEVPLCADPCFELYHSS